MRNRLEYAVAGLAVAALSACGGGSSGPTMGTTTSARGTVVTGTMVKTAATAITVNGIRFDVSGATINIDDQAATAADLRTGMRARVRGSDDGGNGRADDVEVENEVRGAVTAVSAGTTPQFFNIGAVKVIVDSNTVFDDLVPASFAAIQVGVFVEVNGTRDAAGNIMATRVEGKGVRNPNAPEVDELRGTISAINAGASQFNIGAVTVTFTASTTFTPAPRCSAASLATGLEVEVHGAFTATNAFAATRIECEDMEDDEHDGMENGGEASVEGFVANLDTTAHTFMVDGQLVSYSSTTEFRDGTVAELVANAQVEVKGTLNGTTLVASEIEFERD